MFAPGCPRQSTAKPSHPMKVRSPTQESLLLWAPSVILAFAVLIPLATLAVELTSGEEAMTGVTTVLLAPDVWRLLAGSVALATAVTIFASVLGVPLGVLLGRTDVGGRGWLLAVHAFPIFVPPFLVALGWFHIVGANGYLGTPFTARLFFGPVGVVAVLGLTFAPIMTSLTALALQNVDPSLEDAGRVVAGPLRVIVRILLPTAWPAVALGQLLVFALALSELGVPMFLRVRTYPASVFARLGGLDYVPGAAAAPTLPPLPATPGLVAIGICVLSVNRPYIRYALLASAGATTPVALLPELAVNFWRELNPLGLQPQYLSLQLLQALVHPGLELFDLLQEPL